MKKETTKDLLTICSDIVVVKFKTEETYKTVKGLESNMNEQRRA